MTLKKIELTDILTNLTQAKPDSHKGDNGKTLIIGGSDLFHSASTWSFTTASKLVDMTFYSSVNENNELLQETKLTHLDGVVVKRSDLSYYLPQVDSVLIGPGMRRDWQSQFDAEELNTLTLSDLTNLDWEFDTQAVTSVLLRSWPQKQWIIDAGALQILQPGWLPKQAVLTPHQTEFKTLLANLAIKDGKLLWKNTLSLQKYLAEKIERISDPIEKHEKSPSPHNSKHSKQKMSSPAQIFEITNLNQSADPIKKTILALLELSQTTNQSIFILKGSVDLIWNDQYIFAVSGGNAGLTKGGTGDVLAGLLAGLTTKNPPFLASLAASALNKQAGHDLYLKNGTFYNTSDLVQNLGLTWGKFSE